MGEREGGREMRSMVGEFREFQVQKSEPGPKLRVVSLTITSNKAVHLRH